VMRSLPGYNARAAATVYALAAHARTPGFADELVEQVNAHSHLEGFGDADMIRVACLPR